MNMTNEQAKFINERAFLVDACGNADEYLIEANKMAISALEKQIPVKAHIRPCRVTGVVGWYCGKCDISAVAYKGSYCPRCGQAIDWTEVSDVR